MASSAYVISGPTAIGDTGQLNTILGDVQLANVVSASQLVYADTGANLTGLSAVSGGVLTTSGTAPSWIAPGAEGTVLTISSGVPAWVAQAESEYVTAVKSGTFVFTSAAANVTNWTVQAGNATSFNATAGTYTPAANGTYAVNLSISYYSSGGGSTSGARFLQIFDSGSSGTIRQVQDVPPPTAGLEGMIQINSIVPMTAGNVYSFRFFRSNAFGTANVVTTNSYISISRNSTLP